jgi:hypothetical protein
MNFDEFKELLRDSHHSISEDFFMFLDDLSSMTNHEGNEVFFRNFQFPSNQDMKLIDDVAGGLVPFIVESTIGQHDIYCFDFEQVGNPTVAVFSDHAIVNR